LDLRAEARPTGAPTHRIVIAAERFVAVPWRSSLSWAEAHRQPVPADDVFPGPRHQVVFEVWDRGDQYVAREVSGARAASDDDVRRLVEWARRRKGPNSLALGPSLPERLPPRARFEPEVRETQAVPRFRFVVQPADEYPTVHPWTGPDSHWLARLTQPFEGVLGDVFVENRDCCRVTFCEAKDRRRAETPSARLGSRRRLGHGHLHPWDHTARASGDHGSAAALAIALRRMWRGSQLRIRVGDGLPAEGPLQKPVWGMRWASPLVRAARRRDPGRSLSSRRSPMSFPPWRSLCSNTGNQRREDMPKQLNKTVEASSARHSRR